MTLGPWLDQLQRLFNFLRKQWTDVLQNTGKLSAKNLKQEANCMYEGLEEDRINYLATHRSERGSYLTHQEGAALY